MNQASAETQVIRVITTVLGVCSFVFLVLTWVPLTASTDSLVFAWQVTSAVVVFGVPMLLVPLAFRVSGRMLRLLLGGYSIAFTLVVLAFVPAMTAPALPEGIAPWPVLITAIGTVPAALAWRPLWAWLCVLANAIIITPVRFLASGGTEWASPLQYGFFTITFAGIFTGLTIVTLSNGRALDAAIAAARTAAASAAAVIAREQEQARLDALVHDEVISTLFYASQGRPELAGSVQRQASKAMEHLARLRESPEGSARPVPADEFVSRMNSVVAGLSPDVVFLVQGSRSAPVAADVAATLAEATAEALRNSIEHAAKRGSVARSVTLVLAEDGISASVVDDGVGFDPRSVPAHRLGIAVSIRGRLDTIAGGRATVTSRPGRGTRVLLEWRAS